MANNKILRSLLLSACAMALVCSVLLVGLQYTQVVTPPPSPAYTVTEQNGHLAVTDEDGATYVYDSVYTYLLPEEDIEALRTGIPIYSDDELRALLEDFGV
ncbi:hypothetical protein LJB77_01740 [Ruminococcaceae bacterium OttesenSCG-928-N02]|nr:hypothetical protein [Ruminococcaceae bacterium OttesenSCG-928-N02]